MLGSLLMFLRSQLPDFPGRQRLLRLLDRCGGPFHATTPSGVHLRVFCSSYMDGIYFGRNGSLDDKAILEKHIAQLEEGDVFVDVGANIGYYSILASRRVGATGRVVAFEPSPRELVRLQQNLELNRCPNVVVLSLGLSGSSGFRELHLADSHTGLNTLCVSDSATHNFKGSLACTIATATFDALMPPEVWQGPVKLLKIDVEGAEFEVLSGMHAALDAGLFETIVVEITPGFLKHFGRCKSDIYGLLSHHGYMPTLNLDTWQYDEVFVRPTSADKPA